MMKTALSILQSVRRRMNLPVPSTLLSLTDPDELQLLEILYAVCEELRQSRAFAVSKRTFSFTTSPDVDTYPFPLDYYSPLMETHWNGDENQRLVGPLSDAAFGEYVYGDSSSSTNYIYRIFGGDLNSNSEIRRQLQLYPTPSEGDTLYLDYISRNLFLPKHWQPSTAYTIGTYVSVNGIIYLCDQNGTSAASDPPSTISTNITDGTTRWDAVSDAYETVIADTDLCIFDNDLVKLGVRAKWLEEKGGDYEAAQFEYKSKIDRAVARMKGSFRGSFCKDNSRLLRYSYPSRSWSF